MKTKIELSSDQINHIEQALIYYIDYLRDGDEDDRYSADKVEKTYNYIEENI